MRTYLSFFAVYIFLMKISIAQTFSEVATLYDLADSRPTGSATWIDFDNDGDFDILTVPTDGNNFMVLLRNDGDVFVDIADDVGLSTNLGRLSVGDFNNDGYLDILASILFRNEYFTNESFTEVGSFGRSNFIDYDNDGDLDIYASLQGSSSGMGKPNILYRNDLESGFIAMPNALGANDGGFSRQAIWCDYDNDNDMDVFVANGRNQRNTLYRNDFNISGVFTDVTVDLGLVDYSYTEGACWGDYDNDGDFDLYVVNFSNNLLYRNDLNTINKFTEVSLALGLSINDNSRHACWADFDNDGHIDLYVVNVEDYPNRLYRNRVFEDNGFEATGEMVDTQLGFGGSWGDFDSDGDLDFYLVGGNYGNTTINRLYKNNSQSNGNNWIHIKAIGTRSNYSAIGTTIEIKSGTLYQKKFVEGTTGYGSQNSLPVEFGLANLSVIDTIEITWSSGKKQVLTDVDVNQFLTIEEIYLNADFIADTTYGEPPLTVTFTDNSNTIDPYTINSWLWDFNNDGTFDSEIQNPEWTYQQDGSYSVKLIVSNGVSKDSLLIENYINVISPSESPIIMSIRDVPNDQGGWVFVDFIGSIYDNDGLKNQNFTLNSTEFYTVELDDGSGWLAANSTGAYGQYKYSILVPTPFDSTIYSDGMLNFRVIAFMEEGNYVSDVKTGYSLVNTLPSKIDNVKHIPKNIVLYQNYPNPFNPKTVISWQLAESSNVELSIYDILGQKIRTLFNKPMPAGFHEVEFNGQNLSSGVYIYRIVVDSFGEVEDRATRTSLYHDVKKMILIR